MRSSLLLCRMVEYTLKPVLLYAPGFKAYAKAWFGPDFNVHTPRMKPIQFNPYFARHAHPPPLGHGQDNGLVPAGEALKTQSCSRMPVLSCGGNHADHITPTASSAQFMIMEGHAGCPAMLYAWAAILFCSRNHSSLLSDCIHSGLRLHLSGVDS